MLARALCHSSVTLSLSPCAGDVWVACLSGGPPSPPCAGDVWPSSGLRASVAARSFKRELIVIGESRVNPFLQVWSVALTSQEDT